MEVNFENKQEVIEILFWFLQRSAEFLLFSSFFSKIYETSYPGDGSGHLDPKYQAIERLFVINLTQIVMYDKILSYF